MARASWKARSQQGAKERVGPLGAGPAVSTSDPGEQASSSALPRPLGTSSGLIVHRTIEIIKIANLDVEIRDKTAEIEDAEDEETVARLTAEIEQLKDRKQKLKERAREEDRKAKAIKQAGQFKLTSENVLSQEWHDSR